jgi:hypothetical protein
MACMGCICHQGGLTTLYFRFVRLTSFVHSWEDHGCKIIVLPYLGFGFFLKDRPERFSVPLEGMVSSGTFPSQRASVGVLFYGKCSKKISSVCGGHLISMIFPLRNWEGYYAYSSRMRGKLCLLIGVRPLSLLWSRHKNPPIHRPCDLHRFGSFCLALFDR